MGTSSPNFAGWLGQTNDITRMFLAAGQIPDLINMAGGLPESGIFPVSDLAQIAAEAVSRHSAESLGYGAIEGLPCLRDSIAERFSKNGVSLGRENVLITSGGMQGLDLVGKVLLNTGDLIAAQTPAYLGALDAWRPRSPQYRAFVVDDVELDPQSILDGTQFAYTVPNFSNPTGKLVSTNRRTEIVAAAHTTKTWLIEDDPYGSLFYDGAPLPRMLEISASDSTGIYKGPVIYMGTLSKEIAPGLRIGWVVAAPEIIEALTIAKQGSDMCSSGLSQRIAFDAIETGLIEKTRPTILSTYRERRNALCSAMTEFLSPYFKWEQPVGGMFVWAVSRNQGLDTDSLLKVALDFGVCVTPSSVFDPFGKDRSAIRINFTFNSPERLAEGTKRLARAVSSLHTSL